MILLLEVITLKTCFIMLNYIKFRDDCPFDDR